MNVGFWGKLKKPILALAPMANVTDAAFRRVIAKYGKPDVMFTEFTSADGLMSAGREKLFIDLLYSESERPIVAQLFSGNPEKIFEAAELVCPDRSIEKSGAGAALIKDPRRAREVLRAAKEGAGTLPVSVKTRLGYNKDILDEWLPELLAEKPAAVIIHARTRKEMSKVPARWERVKRAVEIRNALKSETLILGNGDLLGVEDAQRRVTETGADGAMLGRAIFGNLWLFQCSTEHWNSDTVKAGEKLKVMVEHIKLFEELLGRHKNFAIMKKHFKAYVEGFDGAKELRMRLMETENVPEVEAIITAFLAK